MNRFQSRARWPILLAGGMFLLTVLGLQALRRLDASPHLLTPDWNGPAGAMPAGVLEAEAALVLDPTVIARAAAAGRFSARDSSAAWWNWLTQAVGPARALTPDGLTSEGLAGLRLLVLTRSAAGTPTPAALAALRNLVQAGGAVVLELPAPGWESLTGVTLSGPDLPTGKLTRTTLPMPAPFLAAFSRLELPTVRKSAEAIPPTAQALATSAPASPLSSEVRPILWIDDAPAAFARHLEHGLVITLAVDLGRLWQTLQQGRPDEDMQVRNRYPDVHSWPVETNDMVIDSSLLQSEVPLADVLEDGLFRFIADDIALPAWWLYPDAHPGAFLMSHDEEAIGGKALWMAENETCRSTNFLVPSPALTRADILRFKALGDEVGLHYVLPGPNGEDFPGSGYDIDGRYQTYGLWKLQPLRRLFTPTEQRKWLEQLAGPTAAPASFRISNEAGDSGWEYPLTARAVPVAPVSRTHFLAWTPGYTALFQGLAAAGIKLDSSYGPDKDDRGFLFGTGRPFRPLGPDGLPMPIRELPYISAENLGGADQAFMERMLEQSAESTHQALSVLFHPNAFGWHPSVDNYATWKGMCQLARKYDHWATTMSGLETFTTLRERSLLQSRVTLDGLIVRHHFRSTGGTIAIPERWRGRKLKEIDGLADKEIHMTSTLGIPVRLLVVPAGPGTLTVHYAVDTGE